MASTTTTEEDFNTSWTEYCSSILLRLLAPLIPTNQQPREQKQASAQVGGATTLCVKTAPCSRISYQELICLTWNFLGIIVGREGMIVPPALLRLEFKEDLYVFGPLHGNLSSLITFLVRVGVLIDQRSTHPQVPFAFAPISSQFPGLIFLGDLCNLGPFSLETVLVCFLLKIWAPEKVWILRGNHENPETTGRRLMPDIAPADRLKHLKHRLLLWSIADYYDPSKAEQLELSDRDVQLWTRIRNCFFFLPVAAIVNETIFCSHSGIVPSDLDFEFLDSLQPPFMSNAEDATDEERYLEHHLLWSSFYLSSGRPPPKSILNPSGFGYTYSKTAFEAFMKRFGFRHLICSQESPKNDGYHVPHTGTLTAVTVFSSIAYNPQLANGGSIAHVLSDGTFARITLGVKDRIEMNMTRQFTE